MVKLITLRYLFALFLIIALYSENCNGQILDVFVIGQQLKGDHTKGIT